MIHTINFSFLASQLVPVQVFNLNDGREAREERRGKEDTPEQTKLTKIASNNLATLTETIPDTPRKTRNTENISLG